MDQNSLSELALRNVHKRSPQRYASAVDRSRSVQAYIATSRSPEKAAPVLQQRGQLVAEAEAIVLHKLAQLQMLRPQQPIGRSSPSRSVMGHYTPAGRSSPVRLSLSPLRPKTPMANTHHMNQDSSLMRGWW